MWPSPKFQAYETTGDGKPVDLATNVTARAPAAGLIESSAVATVLAAGAPEKEPVQEATKRAAASARIHVMLAPSVA